MMWQFRRPAPAHSTLPYCLESECLFGIAAAVDQVFTFPPSTDPTLYLMPNGAFTDYGATRQGENSQYFGGSHFEANQFGESAAVVRTTMATVGKSILHRQMSRSMVCWPRLESSNFGQRHTPHGSFISMQVYSLTLPAM